MFESLGGSALEGLRRELRALGLLGDHPHVVSVHDSGLTVGGLPFLVMPLFSEGSYGGRVVGEGPLGWVEVVDVGVKLCSALEVTHRGGILNRDIKPDNVFVGEYRAHPVLGDFGISTTEDGQQGTTGAVAYTLSYAAPEVIEGEKQTTASDIYSLGATFRYMVGGVPPYSAASTTAVLNKILNHDPQPLPMGLPSGLVELLGSMIARDPSHRPATCLDVANQLREIQETNGESQTPLVIDAITDEPASTTEDPDPPAVSRTPVPNPRDIPTRPVPVVMAEVTQGDGVPAAERSNRSRWVVAGVSVVAVALLVGVLVGLSRTDTEDTASLGEPESPVVTELAPDAEEEDLADVEEEPADVPSSEPVIFDGHEGAVLAATALPDGRIASSGEDATLQIWDPENLDAEPEVFEAIAAGEIRVLADGRLVTGSVISSEVRVWDPSNLSGNTVVWGGADSEMALSVSIMSGDRIVSGNLDGTIRIWDLSAPSAAPILFFAYEEGVVSVVELPGNRLASASFDGTVKIWDLNKPGAVHTTIDDNFGFASSLVVSNDGRLVIGNFLGDILVRDPDDLDADTTILRGHVGAITSLDILEDGRIISGAQDGFVRVWDLNDAVPAPTVLDGEAGEIKSVAPLGDNQVIAGTIEGTVLVWNLPS